MKRSDWSAAGLYYEFVGNDEDRPRWDNLPERDRQGWYRVASFVYLPDDPFRAEEPS